MGLDSFGALGWHTTATHVVRVNILIEALSFRALSCWEQVKFVSMDNRYFEMLNNPALPATRDRITPTERWITVGLVVITIVVVIASLLSLTTYPPVFIDEPWYSDAAWNLANKGVNFESMSAGALDQWPAYWVRWPLIGNLPLAAAFAIGGLGLFQARLVSWLLGVLLLGLVFALGRRLYSTLTAALTTTLLAVSPVFLQASHYARVDIFLACFVTAALYLFVVGVQDNKRWVSFAAGLIIGLSVDIHMNGALFALSLTMLFVVAYGKQMFRTRNIWYFAAGAVVAVIYYLVVHVAPNPASYFEITRGWQGSMMQPPLASLNPIVILRSLAGEVGRYHFYDHGLDFALIGASVLFLCVRRNKSDRLIVTFVGTAFLLFVFLVQGKHDIYAILFYPFFLLMVAEAFASLLREGRRTDPRRIFTGAILVLFVISSALHVARPVYASRGYDYYDVTNRIRQTIPVGARVAGLPTWWLGLSESYDYRSIMNLTYYHFFNDYTVTQSLEAIHPDYMIVDSGLRGILVDQIGFTSEPGFAMYNLPRDEFEAFLAQRGSKVDEFVNPWHGTFEIYEIHWD
jgi:4-amino-4-deoxy-L-arabinose transferase-like glycosyltransferase